MLPFIIQINLMLERLSAFSWVILMAKKDTNWSTFILNKFLLVNMLFFMNISSHRGSSSLHLFLLRYLDLLMKYLLFLSKSLLYPSLHTQIVVLPLLHLLILFHYLNLCHLMILLHLPLFHILTLSLVCLALLFLELLAELKHLLSNWKIMLSIFLNQLMLHL